MGGASALWCSFKENKTPRNMCSNIFWFWITRTPVLPRISYMKLCLYLTIRSTSSSQLSYHLYLSILNQIYPLTLNTIILNSIPWVHDYNKLRFTITGIITLTTVMDTTLTTAQISNNRRCALDANSQFACHDWERCRFQAVAAKIQ